jgi:hypothetical protein
MIRRPLPPLPSGRAIPHSAFAGMLQILVLTFDFAMPSRLLNAFVVPVK